MSTSLVRTEEEFCKIYQQYVDMVYRICFLYLKSKSETEDTVQNVFLKLFVSTKEFSSENHLKTWLIVTASNECKNNLKHWWRKNTSLDQIEFWKKETPDETLEQLLSLPKKYKIVLYCFYYEGYQTNEIARMLNMKEATVRSYLHRGRIYLRQMIEGVEDEKSKIHSSIKSSSS